MHKLVTAALLALACAACDPAQGQAAPAPTAAAPMRLGAGLAPGTDAFTLAAGTAGTVTVPTGVFVTSLSCHATGSGATLTITPSGPNITDAAAQPAIPVPAGGAYALARPVLAGNANELGAGTTIVFSGTDAYSVTMYAIGGP